VKEVMIAARDAREQSNLPLNWQRLPSANRLQA